MSTEIPLSHLPAAKHGSGQSFLVLTMSSFRCSPEAYPRWPSRWWRSQPTSWPRSRPSRGSTTSTTSRSILVRVLHPRAFINLYRFTSGRHLLQPDLIRQVNLTYLKIWLFPFRELYEARPDERGLIMLT